MLTGEFAEDLAATICEAVRTGVEGWLEDRIAFIRPWGFGLEEISVPVMIWHGSADRNVPFSHGQWLASHLLGASGRRRRSPVGRARRPGPHARRTRECWQTALAPPAETRPPPAEPQFGRQPTSTSVSAKQGNCQWSRHQKPELLTPCLQSMVKMSSTVCGLARSVPSVHRSTAASRRAGARLWVPLRLGESLNPGPPSGRWQSSR